MLKRRELTDPASCMSKAHDDEPTFVLLARDQAAPAAIRVWSAERVRLGKNERADRQVVEANATADLMERTNTEYTYRPAPQPSGSDLIAREREVQKEKGYDAEHDDNHDDASLLRAAMLMLLHEDGYYSNNVDPPTMQGPWEEQLFLWVQNKYRGNLLRRLTIAGAMVAAEIDRLSRLAALIQEDGPKRHNFAVNAKSQGFIDGHTEAERLFHENPERTDWPNPFPGGTDAHHGFEEGVYTFTQK